MARDAWRTEMAGCAPETLIFLDETSMSTTMTPLRARSRRGTRAIGQAPAGKWSPLTLLATLTPTGLGPALHVDGAVDRQAFDTFIATTLAPSLRPGQTVVLDNLSVHKSATARAVIEAAGCALVFLPTYSPDCTPIEQAFAKLKHLLRQAEARSVEAIMTTTQACYPLSTPTDTIGYYRNAGYKL